MSLTYTLDWAAFQISKDSKGENALVRKRIAKLCKDILALKPYVMNIPFHTDFIVRAIVKRSLNSSKNLAKRREMKKADEETGEG